MPISLTLGARRLRFRCPFLVLALAGCVLFTSLGLWQWGRGERRERDWAAYEQAAKAPPLAVTTDRLGQLPRHTRIRIDGRFEPDRQFLLDNITRDGKPGYEILTPFLLADGNVLLVDRGWIAFSGYRDRLPDLPPADAEPRTLAGRLADLPVPGMASGRAAPAADAAWPKVTSFPRREDLAVALGRTVVAPILVIAADDRPPGFEPARNYSYAIQWWSFAGLTLLLFVLLNLEKRR
ncbi:MAG: hypothetical protein RLZZ200_3016 [Pseudomonadota bacterium]|jgi:surfeit locus 1 family protein